MQKYIKFKKLTLVLTQVLCLGIAVELVAQDFGEEGYYDYAADMHSRLACEVTLMDEKVEQLSKKILRIRRYLKRSRSVNDRLEAKLRSIDRTIFKLRSFRNQSRAPLVGKTCPYKPPLDKL